MKKTKLSLILGGLVIVGAVMVSSCKKSTTTTTTPDTSTTSSTDNNSSQQYAHDITNIGSEGIENNNGSLSTYRLTQGGLLSPLNGSATITFNTGSARNMTVVFNQYVGRDGHTRNGTLFYNWNSSPSNVNWFRDSGLILNITTPNNDYTVDGNNIKINSKTITNKGRTSGQLTWTDNSNITITKSAANGGGTIQWNAQWTIALLNTSAFTYDANDGTANQTTYPGVFNGYGGTTPINWAQALIGVSGTFGGTASDGETYTGNISTPLVLNLNCAQPLLSKYLYVAGVLNFTPTGKATRTINYGTGICDLTYTVSIGSFSVTITLP